MTYVRSGAEFIVSNDDSTNAQLVNVMALPGNRVAFGWAMPTFDPDGSGSAAQVEIAVLANHAALTAEDILLI